MSRVWYTSDLHLQHQKVAEIRGFDSTAEHDAVVAGNWVGHINDDDIVWVLGDLTVSSGKIDYALELISTLPGTKHLVAGNHDECHSLHSKAHKWQRKYLEAFETVQTFATRKVDGSRFLMSHFPINGDRGEDRFAEYRLRDAGIPVVHGHTHLPTMASRSHLGTPQVHVGLDAWDLSPVPEEAVVRLIQTLGEAVAA